MNRFRNALQVIGNSSSPLAAAACLVESVTDISERGGDAKEIAQDPAVRILVYHLSLLSNTSQFDDLAAYNKAMSECRERAAKPVLSVVNNGTGAASVADLHDFASRIAMGEIHPDAAVEEARKLVLGVDSEPAYRAPGM